MKNLIRFKLLILFVLNNYNSFCQELPDGAYTSVVGPNSEPVIYNDVNMNTYELLSTNIQFSEKNNIQKVVFNPLKLWEYDDYGFWQDTRINIVQKNGVTTFGVGIGYDGASINRERVQGLFNKINFSALRTKNNGESEADYESYKVDFYKTQGEEYASFYEDLLKNTIKLNFGYNISFFEVIGGDKVDLDEDGFNDNENIVESHNYTGSFTYLFNSKHAISVSGHISNKLNSPKEGEKRVLYIGGSLSYAGEIIELNKKYKSTKEYKSTLFRPAILLGFSLEYQNASKNKGFAKDNITEKIVFTPFLDFKINPKTQFRIGVPVQSFNGLRDEVSFGPFAQWTLQIANKG